MEVSEVFEIGLIWAKRQDKIDPIFHKKKQHYFGKKFGWATPGGASKVANYCLDDEIPKTHRERGGFKSHRLFKFGRLPN